MEEENRTTAQQNNEDEIYSFLKNIIYPYIKNIPPLDDDSVKFLEKIICIIVKNIIPFKEWIHISLPLISGVGASIKNENLDQILSYKRNRENIKELLIGFFIGELSKFKIEEAINTLERLAPLLSKKKKKEDRIKEVIEIVLMPVIPPYLERAKTKHPTLFPHIKNELDNAMKRRGFKCDVRGRFYYDHQE